MAYRPPAGGLQLPLMVCPFCRTQLQVPPGTPVIRCGHCQQVVNVPPNLMNPPVAVPVAAASAPSPHDASAPPHFQAAQHFQGSGGQQHNPYAPPQPHATQHFQPQQSGSSFGHSQQAPPRPSTHQAPPHPSAHQAPLHPSAHGSAGGGGFVPAVGRKKALLIGINYPGTAQALKGCVNDAKCLNYLLENRFKFPQQNILMMHSEQHDRLLTPTRQNIIQGMKWLVGDAQPGDILVFSYSGHGAQSRDRTGEERDGQNETILPIDFKRAGQIVDNEIHDLLVKPLPEGAILYSIVDACHSGTIMDLPFTLDDRTLRWSDEYSHLPLHRKQQKSSRGFVVAFSGCRDDQTSADTTMAQATNKGATGAMTYGFIHAIELHLKSGRKLTFLSLLKEMKAVLKKAKTAGGGGNPFGSVDPMIGSLMSMVMGGSFNLLNKTSSGFSQIPQITSSQMFDPHTEIRI